MITDPHLESRGFWDVVNHPEIGPYKQVTTPWLLSKSRRGIPEPAPDLGEHNHQILSELLGLSDSEIADLITNGITGDIPTA